MEEKIFEGLTYLISYPEGFREDQAYPVIIFLHGVGARSQTTEILRGYSSVLKLKEHQNARGYILLAPLCKGVNWNEWMLPLLHLIENMRACPYMDKTRFYLTGNSMGGYGTWALSTLRPDWFAAAMPLCGGGSAGFAPLLKDLPIRAFHGLCDTRVDPFESLQMVKAVNMAGGRAELILLPGVAHNCWDAVYADENNYDWMFSFTTERDKALSGDVATERRES